MIKFCIINENQLELQGFFVAQGQNRVPVNKIVELIVELSWLKLVRQFVKRFKKLIMSKCSL